MENYSKILNNMESNVFVVDQKEFEIALQKIYSTMRIRKVDSVKKQKKSIIDSLPSTKILYNELIDEKVIDKNIKKATSLILGYINKISSSLSTKGPSKRILFNEKIINDFLKLFNITKSKVDAAKKKVSSSIIEKNNKFKNDHFNIYLSVLICHLAINKEKYFYMKSKKEKHYIYILFTFFSLLKSYSTKFNKYFKYEANNTLMDQVINNYLSNKSDIVKFNTMYEFLYYMTTTQCNENGLFLTRLVTKQDRYSIYFLMNLYSRLNSYLKNIAKIYYTVYENKLLDNSNSNTVIFKEDENGVKYIDDSFNTSSEIESIIEKINSNYTNDEFLNDNIMKISMIHTFSKRNNNTKKLEYDSSNANKNALAMKNFFKEIKSNNETSNIVKDLIIRNIVTNYVNKTNDYKKIHENKKDFIEYSLNTYNISNSNNENINNFKKGLDIIIKDHSNNDNQLKNNHKRTKLRSLIFIYFVLYVAEKA